MFVTNDRWDWPQNPDGKGVIRKIRCAKELRAEVCASLKTRHHAPFSMLAGDSAEVCELSHGAMVAAFGARRSELFQASLTGRDFDSAFPALKRRAIVGGPYGTGCSCNEWVPDRWVVPEPRPVLLRSRVLDRWIVRASRTADPSLRSG